jgi:hypothetical protein
MFHHSPTQLRIHSSSCVKLSPHYARLNKIMRDDGIVSTMVRLFDWKDI